jgi:DNA-binding transcriptional LysR family regulator
MINFDPSISAPRLVQKIVQTGKLTTAAEQLNISQSGASHSLRILESQFGSAIFVRVREGLRMSEAGQRLIPYIEVVLGNLDAVHAELASLSRLKTGSLRVAAVPSLLGSILPPVLREYSTSFPGIELSIFEGTDDEVSNWVLIGIAHVGFAALPAASVLAEEIARDEWLALVPERRALKKSSIALQELLRHRFLMSGGGCETHIQRLFSIQGLNIPNHVMVKQLCTIQAMVARDLGVSLVPSLSIKDVQGVAAIPLKPPRFRSIGMLYASASVSNPALQTWMNLARDRLRSYFRWGPSLSVSRHPYNPKCRMWSAQS